MRDMILGAIPSSSAHTQNVRSLLHRLRREACDSSELSRNSCWMSFGAPGSSVYILSIFSSAQVYALMVVGDAI